MHHAFDSDDTPRMNAQMKRSNFRALRGKILARDRGYTSLGSMGCAMFRRLDHSRLMDLEGPNDRVTSQVRVVSACNTF
jgi:hypothetical protein